MTIEVLVIRTDGSWFIEEREIAEPQVEEIPESEE